MENNVKVNCNRLVFLLIFCEILTLIFAGVNSSELNINGEFLFLFFTNFLLHCFYRKDLLLPLS